MLPINLCWCRFSETRFMEVWLSTAGAVPFNILWEEIRASWNEGLDRLKAYKSNLSIGHRETHKSSNFTLISQWCCRILVTWPKISSVRRIFEYPYENQNGHSSNKDTELLLPQVDSTGPIPYFTLCISIKSHQGSALHRISCIRK